MHIHNTIKLEHSIIIVITVKLIKNEMVWREEEKKDKQKLIE